MEKRALQPNDLYTIQCAGDAQVSPDGRLLAYVVQRVDAEKDRSFTDIFLYDFETGQKRRLTSSGKNSSPRFSPDGQRLAFISSRSEKSQIWVLELVGGEAWQLPTEQPVSGAPIWSADSKQIVYTSNVFSRPEEWIPYPGAPSYDSARLQEIANRALQEGKKDDGKKKNEVKVITSLRYRADGVGYLGDVKRQVFVTPVPLSAPLADLKPESRQVTTGDYDHGTPALSPDGRYLVSSVRRSETADYDLKSDLWLFDLDTGDSCLLYDAPGPVSTPLWSPCGQVIAFAGHDHSCNVSTTTDLWMLNVSAFLQQLASGEQPKAYEMEQAKNLTRPFDRPFGAHAGAELRYGGGSMFWQGEKLFFLMSSKGAGGIYAADLNGQVEAVLVDEHRAISSVAGNAGRLIYSASQPDCLEELYLHDGDTGKPLTEINADFEANVLMGDWEKVTYNSPDGQEVDGWIIYPVGYEPGKKYPLLLLVHGGPHGAYGPAFMFLGQIFAGRGYAVLFTNPRGSTTYGQQFTCAIDQNWGVVDYADIMAGVDLVIERGLVDEEQLFVHGWSFGGYMTCWLVTQTNRFRAACGGAVVSNMLSGYGTSDIIWADEYEYGGQPWKDYVHLMEHSPLGHADKVETPLMLLHGEDDLRCPIGQSEEFYASLKRMGKTAVMIRYPGEFHGLRRPIHRIDRYERLLSWFEYYRGI